MFKTCIYKHPRIKYSLSDSNQKLQIKTVMDKITMSIFFLCKFANSANVQSALNTVSTDFSLQTWNSGNVCRYYLVRLVYMIDHAFFFGALSKSVVEN